MQKSNVLTFSRNVWWNIIVTSFSCSVSLQRSLRAPPLGRVRAVRLMSHRHGNTIMLCRAVLPLMTRTVCMTECASISLRWRLMPASKCLLIYCSFCHTETLTWFFYILIFAYSTISFKIKAKLIFKVWLTSSRWQSCTKNHLAFYWTFALDKKDTR